jgi:predicted metalloendopeptidase
MNTSINEKTARKTLTHILHQVGKSPSLSQDWEVKDFNLGKSLIYAHQHKINALFRIGVTIDDRNTNYHRIYFEQSGLSFDEKSLYDDQNIRYLFNDFGTRLLKHLGSFLPDYKISEQIDEIFLFEKRLANIFQLNSSNHPLTLYPQIRSWFSSWLNTENYFERIFHKDKSVFYNQTFLISTPEYFEQHQRGVKIS